MELQAKLLRVLQDGRFERLGSPKTVTVNVRIIAATNRNLEQAVRDGKFRADLYHRLNVFPIRVPPLRERRDDIPPLAWAFVEAFGRRMGKTIKNIPRKTMEQLQRYSWPGNVRELSNVIERAMILTTGRHAARGIALLRTEQRGPPMTLKKNERAHILQVLQETGWRVRGVGTAPPKSSGSNRQRWRREWRNWASNAKNAAPIYRRNLQYIGAFHRLILPFSAIRRSRISFAFSALTHFLSGIPSPARSLLAYPVA